MLLFGLLAIALGLASLYPSGPSASEFSGGPLITEWMISQQREYGWPWKCVIHRPATNNVKEFDIGVDYVEVRTAHLIGNVAVAVILLVGLAWVLGKLSKR